MRELRYRAVPDRYLTFPDFALDRREWEALQIPVGLAFFFRNSALGRTVAFYPGPAGATESELDMAAWNNIRESDPRVDMLADDTEALIVRVPDEEGGRPGVLSSCRSTPATSSSAGCGCCGTGSTAASRSASSSPSSSTRSQPAVRSCRRDRQARSEGGSRMTEVTFAVVDVSPQPYAVTPVLAARVGVAAVGDDPVHAIALRCQVRIDPLRRRYSDDEAAGLLDLFGPRERWSTTQRTFVWLHCAVMVPGFSGATQVELPLECTYDFEVTAAKYMHALRDGTIPLQFLFSGTVFTQGERGFAVQQVPWDREDRYDLPVSVWRDLMDQHYPNTGWVRLNRDTLDALAAYKSERGMLGFDDAVTSLLETSSQEVQPVSGGWDRVRTIADAVLYEGYLLYPYRANSRKNQSRWQFGVLGPPRAEERGIGENDTLSAQVLLDGDTASLSVVVRFLQLQRRTAERDTGDGLFEAVDELTADGQTWLTWDEAVERELSFGPFPVADLEAGQTIPLTVAGGTDTEAVDGGRLVRSRRELNGELTLAARTRRRSHAGQHPGAQYRCAAGEQGRRDRRLVHRHASDRRGHRR